MTDHDNRGSSASCMTVAPVPALVDGSLWRDKQGDIWSLGDDGLMHARETAPFSREHVERKWGPLTLVPASVVILPALLTVLAAALIKAVRR